MSVSCLRYCKSTIFQANHNPIAVNSNASLVVCDTAKVRFFKQITTECITYPGLYQLFAILQKYDFSSKSQPKLLVPVELLRCLRYCKSTIFQANHNGGTAARPADSVVCDTAKVRFFKQITTSLQVSWLHACCLRYCKSTIFQANHNGMMYQAIPTRVVCDTAKVRFFKQITTLTYNNEFVPRLFAILQKYDFSSKSQPTS